MFTAPLCLWPDNHLLFLHCSSLDGLHGLPFWRASVFSTTFTPPLGRRMLVKVLQIVAVNKAIVETNKEKYKKLVSQGPHGVE